MSTFFKRFIFEYDEMNTDEIERRLQEASAEAAKMMQSLSTNDDSADDTDDQMVGSGSAQQS